MLYILSPMEYDSKAIPLDSAPYSVKNDEMDERTSLHNMSNGAKEYGTVDDKEPDAGDPENPFAQSQITAWQAAWNVTNAIQVLLTKHHESINVKIGHVCGLITIRCATRWLVGRAGTGWCCIHLLLHRYNSRSMFIR